MHQTKTQPLESFEEIRWRSAAKSVSPLTGQAAFSAFRLLPCFLLLMTFATNIWAQQSTVDQASMIQRAETETSVNATANTPARSRQTQEKPASPGLNPNDQLLQINPQDLTSQAKVSSTIQLLLSIGVLSLAPALILMSTSFVRIVIVLGILRQALGTQQLPPTQVIMALSLFMTFLIMAPVFNEVKKEALDPYTSSEQSIDWDTAWERGTKPIKRFMSRQIDTADNSDDIWLFFQYLPEEERKQVPQTYEQVPLKVLLPAFLISELKIAFIIGVQIYLPFLILDIVISSVTVSMGMMMLPPTIISLPFKLLLFVMVDGWTLIVGMLLESFAP